MDLPSRARPVLKWAGGKGQLLPELLRRVPPKFGTYHEPFVGGAALFFELAARGRIQRAVLSDINPALIDVYTALRDCVDDVVEALRGHVYDRERYYAVRALDPEALSLPERAARVIYLNRTCYNGLYRENRSGRFNVPFGRYVNPTILDACEREIATYAGNARMVGYKVHTVYSGCAMGDPRLVDLFAVMARRPATISPIRCAGTPISLARRYLVMPMGFRNSSERSSPGVTGLSLPIASP